VDSDARETRSPHRHNHLLQSVAGFVSRARRHEHSVYPTANYLAEEWVPITMPTQGLPSGTGNFHHDGRGKRPRGDSINRCQ
jgi:hypothetical protein